MILQIIERRVVNAHLKDGDQTQSIPVIKSEKREYDGEHFQVSWNSDGRLCLRIRHSPELDQEEIQGETLVYLDEHFSEVIRDYMASINSGHTATYLMLSDIDPEYVKDFFSRNRDQIIQIVKENIQRNGTLRR